MDKTSVENGSSHLMPSNDSLLQVAFRHRWTILNTTFLFLAVAFIYLLRVTPIYTSSSRLLVEPYGPKIISEYEGMMVESKNYLYTQGELIRSRSSIANYAEDSGVRNLRTFNGIDNIVDFISGKLSVSIGKKDDIITVSFDSPYPEEAAQIVNGVVNSYIEHQSLDKRSTVSEVLTILQKEKIKLDVELDSKFDQLLKFTRENGIVSYDEKGGNVIYQKLTKLADALTEAQLATINARADYEVIKSMAGEPLKIKQFASSQPSTSVHVLTADVETHLKSLLRETEVDLENVKYHVTPDHPSIKALESKIHYVKQQLNEDANEFSEIYTEVMRLRWQSSKQREDELQKSFDAQTTEAQELGVKSAEYMVLQSELRRLEKFCDSLDSRIKNLNVTEEAGALNIKLLEVARAEDYPSSPKKAKIMLTALLFGLLAGFGLALVRDWMDYRLRSVEEVSAILNIPVLGVVPAMSENRTIAGRGRQLYLDFKTALLDVCQKINSAVNPGSPSGKKFAGAKSTDAAAVLNKEEIIARGQKVFLESKSTIAEAYRTIRTAVFFGAPKNEAKTILVTSPSPGDGKSTLVSNLAIAMAQAGQKTLIVDADFRKPMQHNIFGLDSSKGVTSIIAGVARSEDVIQAGPVEGLDILCCGPEVPNPSEILNSEAFLSFLKDNCIKYDRVVVDSPPVGAVADTQILSAICDLTVLVLRAEKSTRKHSRDACDGILSVGGRLLGVVVNDVPRKRGHYGYYGNYGYYGRYGVSEERKD